MPDDVTTDEEEAYRFPLPLVERDQWELAFEPLKADPYAALQLGRYFTTMRKYLEARLIKPQAIIEAFDLAREVLFPLTDFHKSSFDLFKRLTEGDISTEEEDMLKAQGIRF
nr:hypothetical protein [uncultured bacterium]